MILITRPIKAAQNTLAQLKMLNLKAKTFPFIKIENFEFFLNQKYDYVLITSHNAIYALHKIPLDTEVIVIGYTTAKKISKLGFKINSIFENSEELLKNISNQITDYAKILFLSGDHITSNFVEHLSNLNFEVIRAIVYNAIAIDEMPLNILNGIKIITFYSSRTAQIFAQHNRSDLSNITAICISLKTAEQLNQCNFKKIIIAAAPNEQEIIRKIQEHYVSYAQ